MALQSILDVLDDSKHPGTVSVWWALLLLLLVLLAVWRLYVAPFVRGWRERRAELRRHRRAMAAWKQKDGDGY